MRARRVLLRCIITYATCCAALAIFLGELAFQPRRHHPVGGAKRRPLRRGECCSRRIQRTCACPVRHARTPPSASRVGNSPLSGACPACEVTVTVAFSPWYSTRVRRANDSARLMMPALKREHRDKDRKPCAPD